MSNTEQFSPGKEITLKEVVKQSRTFMMLLAFEEIAKNGGEITLVTDDEIQTPDKQLQDTTHEQR